MHTSPWTVEDRLAHLERRVAVLERMGRLSRLITSTLDLHRLLSIITEAAAELTNTEAASIALVQPETGELYFETASGPAKDTVKRYTIPLEGSVAGWVFTHNQPVMIRDARNDPRHFPVIDQQTGFQTRSLPEAPLNVRGETIGVIMAVNYQQDQIRLVQGFFGLPDYLLFDRIEFQAFLLAVPGQQGLDAVLQDLDINAAGIDQVELLVPPSDTAQVIVPGGAGNL